MGQDSTHALWVDPLAFDAEKNGPPYLPETKKMANAFSGLEAHWELGALISVLRAASIVHQSHHWQTSGGNFYGDHLLFDRIYNESLPFIDSVAERAVGSSDGKAADVLNQVNRVHFLVHHWLSELADGPTSYAATSLHVERCVIKCVEDTRRALSAQRDLSDGTDNLLQGVADKHEEFVYLLQQRLRTASYDYR